MVEISQVLSRSKGGWPELNEIGATLKFGKLDSYKSDTANDNEKFVVSSGIWTRIFGFLDRRSTNWAIEPTGVGSESYPI